MKFDIFCSSKIIHIQSQIPDDILSFLKKESNYILKNQDQFQKYNETLAGNIEKEYSLKKYRKILSPIVCELANKFVESSNDIDKFNVKTQEDINVNWHLSDMWINFQKKYEFNPIHNHYGLLSFVLWVQIPYDLKEELNLLNSQNSNSPKNSLFEFVFTNLRGEIETSEVNVDKSYEGKIMIFPSNIHHLVYPFYTSDEYRISISGNLINRRKNKIINYQ